MNRLLTNAPSCPEYFADVQHNKLVPRNWGLNTNPMG